MPLIIILSKTSGHHDVPPFFPASAASEERRTEGEEFHEAADAADGDSDCAGEGDD